MKRCVIVGGASVNNYAAVKQYLKSDDYAIYCDCGLRHTDGLGKQPDLIIGDFDSHARPDTDTEIIVLPCEKDDTDTVYAAKEGIKRGFDSFLLVGVIGDRFDHTLANTAILAMFTSLGKSAIIVDDFSEMEVVSGKSAYIDDTFAYFSLLNIYGKASGITIKNAKYPLDDAEITADYQYGVSNEVIPGKTAEVSIKEGSLLLIKVRS